MAKPVVIAVEGDPQELLLVRQELVDRYAVKDRRRGARAAAAEGRG